MFPNFDKYEFKEASNGDGRTGWYFQAGNECFMLDELSSKEVYQIDVKFSKPRKSITVKMPDETTTATDNLFDSAVPKGSPFVYIPADSTKSTVFRTSSRNCGKI